MNDERSYARGENRSDLTKEDRANALGSHPVGTAVGGVAGGVAGAAAAGAMVGTAAGPVGTAVGAIAGAVAGALAGKGIAAMIDPAAEDSYWRDNYAERSYADTTRFDYDRDYAPAYRYGVDSFGRSEGRAWDDVEPELQQGWGSMKGESRLEWDHARHATRDAWNRLSDRVERAVPGDSDHDGR